MTSLAGEETAERKAVFGRCALIETEIRGAHWLVIEEQVKGASPGQEEGIYIAEKKSRFSFSRRGRLARRKTTAKKKVPAEEPYNREQSSTPMSKIGAEQHAKIQEAAAQLAKGQQPKGFKNHAQLRGNQDDALVKNNSNQTLQPAIISEAGPALKWATNFDKGDVQDSKEDVRAAYLNDKVAGTGRSGLLNPSSSALNISTSSTDALYLRRELSNRDLPALPKEKAAETRKNAKPSTPPPTTPPKYSSSANKTKHRPLVLDDKSKVDDAGHPALRGSDSPESTKSPGSVQVKSSAELRHEPRKLQKKEKEGGGFKKLFGRKKPAAAERSEAPAAEKHATKPPKFTPIVIPTATEAEPRAPTPEPASGYDSPPRSIKNEEPTFNEPTFDDHAPLKYSARDEARREALERLEADREFSRFDQGPLEDVPVFIPEETPESSHAAPSPVIKSSAFTSRIPAAAPVVPRAEKREAPSRLRAPVITAPSVTDNQSDVSEESSTIANPSDRWAQIRKNAAERAQRLNEEHSHGRNHSASARSDDGETSGEETIESRVARIKARVAELTGTVTLTPLLFVPG
jgi:hypothetical protein